MKEPEFIKDVIHDVDGVDFFSYVNMEFKFWDSKFFKSESSFDFFIKDSHGFSDFIILIVRMRNVICMYFFFFLAFFFKWIIFFLLVYLFIFIYFFI